MGYNYYYSSNSTGQGLFYDCPLESVYLGRNLSYSSGSSYGYSPFYNKDALTHVTIGGEVTTITNYAFYGCDNIPSLTIHSGVLSIGNYAFSTPDKVIWLTNTPPTGYANAKGNINYVANDQYTSLSNVHIYPYLSSMFEVDGVKYVPVSPSERTCHAIDCAYDSTAEIINVGETTSFKGVAMKVTEVMPYTFYGNNHIKEVAMSHLGNIGNYAFYNTFTKIQVDDLIIRDGEESFTVEEEQEYKSITYTRNFKNTNWQALYVPFEIPYEVIRDDFAVAYINDVHQFDDDDNGTIDRTRVEAIKVTGGVLKANYPYMIRAKVAGEKSITVTDATLYAAEENSIDCSSVFDTYPSQVPTRRYLQLSCPRRRDTML